MYYLLVTCGVLFGQEDAAVFVLKALCAGGFGSKARDNTLIDCLFLLIYFYDVVIFIFTL